MKAKYKLIFILILVFSVSDKAVSGLVNNSAQIVISSDAHLVVSENYTSEGSGAVSGNGIIDLKGNLVNNNSSGNPVSATGTIIFSGSAQQQISGNSIAFGNVSLSNPNGIVMGCDASVAGTLTLTTGDLDLNGHVVSFGTDAELIETAGNTLTNTIGNATISMSLNNPSAQNVAGMGAQITSSANLGSTTISRGHSAQSGGGNQGIYRWYDISPTNNSGLDATLVFHYDDSELNGITESNLVLFRSTDGGDTWTPMGGTVNTSENTITLSGISAFSRWTAGDEEGALPVMLDAFTVTIVEDASLLEWSTVIETGLAGFEVYRRSDVEEYWQLIASYQDYPELVARGGELKGNDYSFTDESVDPLKNYNYLLVGIDFSGQRLFETQTEMYTDVACNEKVLPEKYQLFPAYPNPFNPATTIKFALPENQHVKIRVFDVSGRQVAELVNKSMNAGMHRVDWNAGNSSSGTYFIWMETEKFQAKEKCLLVK